MKNPWVMSLWDSYVCESVCLCVYMFSYVFPLDTFLLSFVYFLLVLSFSSLFVFISLLLFLRYLFFLFQGETEMVCIWMVVEVGRISEELGEGNHNQNTLYKKI